MAEKRVIELEIQDNVKSLKTQYKEAIQEVQRLADTYGTTSKEAAEAAKRAAELKDRIEESKSLTDAFNPDAKFNALSGSIGGVLNAFQAYEGAMGLMGVESEQLQETLLKVQSAMALSQGIQGALEAKDAFMNLGAVVKNAFTGMTAAGKAFAVTGIGLLITGIGLLVANWDKLTGKTNTNTEAQKKNMEAAKARQEAVSQAQKSAIDTTAKESVEFFKLANALKQTNISSKEREKIINQMNAQYGTTLKNLKDEAAFQNQINKAVQDFVKYQNIKIQSQVIEQQLFNIGQQRFELETKLQDLNVGNAKTLQNLGKEQKKTNSIIDQSLSSINNQSDALSGLNTQTKLITENQNKAYNKQGAQTIAQSGKIKDQISKLDTQFADLAKTLSDLQSQMGGFNKKTENSTKSIADYAKSLEKERIDAMEDGMEKRIKLLQFELARELSEIDKKGKKAGELRKAITDRYEKEIENVREEYKKRELSPERQKTEDDFLINAANRRKNFRITIQKATNNELLTLQQDLINKQKELEKASARETLKERTDLALKYAKTFTDAYSSLNSLLNASDNERLKKVKSGSKEEENIKRRMFKRDKALRISQTVVDTASNIVTSVRNGGGVPTGIPFGIAAGAMGALQIAAIAKAKFDGGDNGTQNAPDATAGTNVSAPQFNTIGSSGINQLAQLQMQPVQAYVVSGQVTSAQALDRNRIQNSSL